MDQEQLAKKIKDLRTKSNLSQEKFGNKYGVTYQAVSKWENGKALPDISILHQICEDYNLDINTFLSGKIKKKINKKYILFISVLILLILVFLFAVLIHNKNHNFSFKTLSSSCPSFTLYGSMAYNNKKSSIYINNITYCGGDDNKTYKNISCTLYEKNNNGKTKISNCNYNSNKKQTLEQFLKDINIKVDNYDKTCKNYTKNTLELEIDLVDEDGVITSFKIPLGLDDDCN